MPGKHATVGDVHLEITELSEDKWSGKVYVVKGNRLIDFGIRATLDEANIAVVKASEGPAPRRWDDIG